MGKIKNPAKTAASKISRKTKENKPTKINKDLKAIPIKMENFTSPSLYSFFQGLKNVLSIKGIEKTLKNDLFRVKK